MSNRFFENAQHTKLYQQFRPSAPKALVEHVVNYLKEKYHGELGLAVDVGCGSGQNTFVVAEFFKKVVGTDVSPNQVTNAKDINEKSHVTFEVSPAEKMEFPDGSVQLITAMAAAHWFDLPRFFEEGRRVLCPGGVMALYGYSVSTYTWERDPKKTEAIGEVYGDITIKNELAPYWTPPILELVFTGYRSITIPYDDFVRDNDTFYNTRKMTLADMMGETQTWSGFEKFRQDKGDEAAKELIERLRTKILEIIDSDLTPEERANPDEVCFQERTPMVLLLARKSAQ